MLKNIGLVLILCVVALIGYAYTRPDSFRVERSISINVPPETVYPLIADFHQWEAWSPWEKVDPQVKRSYEGAPSGRGSIYSWQGNKEIGAGRMEIVDVLSPNKVVIQIDFIEPFEAHNTVEFTLARQGSSTRVTQAMYGPSPFISKVMGIFFSMDKMVGDKYQEGLATLKALAERR